MVKALKGGWFKTQGGQKVRGREAAETLEAAEAPVPQAGPSGRPTPRQIAVTDSGDGPAHRGRPHSLARGQGDGGPVYRCIIEGCDYQRRRY